MIKGINLFETTNTENQFEVFKIDPGVIQGVNIPCVLALPKNLTSKSKLTLCFNNEGGETLDKSASNILKDIPKIIEMLKFDSPVVVPILPSKKEFNDSLKEEGIDLEAGEPKQFARECFLPEITEESRFYRLDEQVNTLIQNIINNQAVKSEIQSQRANSGAELEFDDKLIGIGHSGGGAAMLRFAVARPELLDTLIIGGNADIIPTPFGKNGDKLEYPFGNKDYEDLFGREFSEEAYQAINFQFYIGDREDTNPIFDTIRDENYVEGKTGNNFAPKQLADIYKGIYGKGFYERFKNALREYEVNGYTVGLKIYENDCHSMIQAGDFHGITDGTAFFESNCSEQLENLIQNKQQDNVIETQQDTTNNGKISLENIRQSIKGEIISGINAETTHLRAVAKQEERTKEEGINLGDD